MHGTAVSAGVECGLSGSVVRASRIVTSGWRFEAAGVEFDRGDRSSFVRSIRHSDVGGSLFSEDLSP
jgi:hypothetical protein